MIRMVENHRFLMFFFDPWRAKSSHRRGKTQIFTLESHACQSKWMSMLHDSCKYQHFVSYPYKGAESTGCLVFESVPHKLVWLLLSVPLLSAYRFGLVAMDRGLPPGPNSRATSHGSLGPTGPEHYASFNARFRMSEYMSGRISTYMSIGCQIELEIKWQNECQNSCRNTCPTKCQCLCQKIWPE